MATEILLHGKHVHSVFELLGAKENDLTYSIGWAFAQCPEFRGRFAAAILPDDADTTVDAVLLQQRDADGITDIELKGRDLHVVVEAKAGLALPDLGQLSRYATRIRDAKRKHTCIVTMSAASVAYARTRLPRDVDGIKCVHMGYAEVAAFASERKGSHVEKRLLNELAIYLRRHSQMQDQSSNIVYVVVLSDEMPEGCEITWREIVEKRGMYFHPVGRSYPTEPVNYIGFRYGGQLRSVHHVEGSEVFTDLGDRIPGFRYPFTEPHYLYTLGPPIVPSKTVRNGSVVMANRVYAAIDLLLTCDTISEAGEKTRQRLGRA